MLYDTLLEYDTFTFCNDVKDEANESVYKYVESYNNLHIDPDNKDYIVFDDDNHYTCKLKQTLEFVIIPLNFNRDRIEVSIGNKKINIICKKSSFSSE